MYNTKGSIMHWYNKSTLIFTFCVKTDKRIVKLHWYLKGFVSQNMWNAIQLLVFILQIKYVLFCTFMNVAFINVKCV